jgi:hypothetical protein
MDDLEKSFEESMKPYWEKRLSDFPNTINNRLKQHYKESHKIWREDDKFKKLLFTISGGTLTIFASLGLAEAAPLTILGFLFIGISMICAVLSNLFSPQTLIYSDAKMDKDWLVSDKRDLKEILSNIDQIKNKFEIQFAENSISHYENQLDYEIKKHQKISDSLEPILRKLKLNVQLISDYQKYLFLLGIIFITLNLLSVMYGKLFMSSNSYQEIYSNFLIRSF